MNLYLLDVKNLDLEKFKFLKNNKKSWVGLRILENCFVDHKKNYSLSDSDNLCVLACSKSNVGIDVEKISKHNDWKKISDRLFSNVENKNDFYKHWTGLEAIYKLGLQSKQFVKYLKYDNYLICLASTKKIKKIKIKKIIL